MVKFAQAGEKFNAATHLAGALLAAGGSVYLLGQVQSGPWQSVVSIGVYCFSLVLLYACSTVYHASMGRVKALWQKFDHCAIYVLIAGTYTPFCSLALDSQLGWALLAAVWLLAFVGIVQELRKSENRWLSVGIYLTMGWSAVLMVLPLRASLGNDGFAYVLAGGLFYTVGIIFYVIDTRMRHAHGIWHLFVLLGSALHYLAIAQFVLPDSA